MAVDRHLRFTLALHRAAAAGGADACFSPYSVASALGLVSRAARGRSAEEVLELLAGTGTGEDTDLEPQARLLREAAELDDEAAILAVANTLWASDSIIVEDGFQAELATWPGGRAETAPFAGDPGAARRLINADVDRTTRGLIPELLPDGALDADVRASIVNALYLKTAWRFPFPEGATAPAAFHGPEGAREVPTMRLQETLGYQHADGWQVAVLNAAGGVQAVVLLPDGELPPAEAALDEHRLAALIEGAQRRKVRLALPKVSLDVRTDLDRALKTLGVRELFTPDADLTGLTETRPFWVHSVLHQAVLRLDEQGLEGAAATAVQMRTMSLDSSDPVEVTVDRPFLLLVRHARSGAVYFFARVVRP
ncbi:serpin family protein [Amycolatopsis sp. PS_44_ISF1]|uniref:serpin family protein n=1 Tax=Amycolatopsis sp. PS_44_ISF1 TaxID=2974917 RepID=UPI0028DFEEA8|nr:serpin family protein [Amycolatopsis sp. PS_44_ISF1]MDT8914647.1 serpin family protein [Amycolatopsis sp. PS_44_ISF1]